MSREHQSAVGKLDLPRARKSVMIALAYIAYDNGICYNASKKRLAATSGYSERHVQRTLLELEQIGLIRVLENEQGGRSKGKRIELVITPG